jgi:hypothetical protein
MLGRMETSLAAEYGHHALTARAGVLFFTIQIPALRPLAKYLPLPQFSVPIFLGLALLSTFVLLRPRDWLQRVLRTPWPMALASGALCTATLVLYPVADALKQTSRGSDSDDALILAGTALARFSNPYVQHTYLNQPVHPGPGWAMLTAPLSATGLYALLLPIALTLVLWVLRSAGESWQTINRFMLLLGSSLIVWELAVTGSDYIPFALLLLATFLLLTRPALGNAKVVVLCILVGFLATFRLPFILLPGLYALILAPRFLLRALAVGFGGTLICAALHLPFYLINLDYYPPLHLLIEKTHVFFSPLGLVLAVGVCLSALWVIGPLQKKWGPRAAFAFGLAVPWSIIAFAELVGVEGSLTLWGGASVMTLALPSIVLAVISAETLAVQRREHCYSDPAELAQLGLNRSQPKADAADLGNEAVPGATGGIGEAS